MLTTYASLTKSMPIPGYVVLNTPRIKNFRGFTSLNLVVDVNFSDCFKKIIVWTSLK